MTVVAVSSFQDNDHQILVIRDEILIDSCIVHLIRRVQPSLKLNIKVTFASLPTLYIASLNFNYCQQKCIIKTIVWKQNSSLYSDAYHDPVLDADSTIPDSPSSWHRRLCGGSLLGFRNHGFHPNILKSKVGVTKLAGFHILNLFQRKSS